MKQRIAFYLTIFAIGAFSLAAQTILFREYLVVFNGNELAIGLFYSSWLWWVGIGAILTFWVKNWVGLTRYFSLLTFLYPLMLLGQLLLIQNLKALAGLPAFAYFEIDRLLWWTLISNSPVSLITGIIFPVACLKLTEMASHLSIQENISRIYIFEALGSFGSGMAVTALLMGFVHPYLISLLFILLLAVTSVLTQLSEPKAPICFSMPHVALIAGLVLLLLMPWGRQLNQYLLSSQWQRLYPSLELIDQFETPYQKIALGKRGKDLVIVSNGNILTTLPHLEVDVAKASLMLSQNLHIQKVLLIGEGSHGLIAQLLNFPIAKLTYLEIDRDYFRLIQPYLPREIRTAMQDPRLAVIFSDARSYIASLSKIKSRRFDAIIIDMPSPETAAINRFYTREFFLDCAAVLLPDGFIVTKLPSSENYARKEQLTFYQSIYYTLQLIFKDIRITPGSTNFIFAAFQAGNTTILPQELASHYEKIKVVERLFPASAFSTLIETKRIPFVNSLYKSLGPKKSRALLNTDQRPVTYFYSFLVLGQLSQSALNPLLKFLQKIDLKILILPLFLLLLLKIPFDTLPSPKPNPNRMAALLLAIIGATSISLAIILLFHFQNRFGFIFQKIGLTNSLFMLGLFLGGWGLSALLKRVPQKRQGFWCSLAVLVIPVYCFALPLIEPVWKYLSPFGLEFIHYLLFVLTGILTGIGFPVTATLISLDQPISKTSAVLEFADHLGGAIGALISGVLLVPILGLKQTCFILGAVNLVAWFLLTYKLFWHLKVRAYLFQKRGEPPIKEDIKELGQPNAIRVMAFLFLTSIWLLISVTLISILFPAFRLKSLPAGFVGLGIALVLVSGLYLILKDNNRFRRKLTYLLGAVALVLFLIALPLKPPPVEALQIIKTESHSPEESGPAEKESGGPLRQKFRDGTLSQKKALFWRSIEP